MGQGVGSGSPAETPRLTVRWSVLMIASSEGGPEGPPVLLDQPSRTLTLYLNGLFCFERSLTTYLVPSSAGEEASIRASFSFSRWSLVTSQSVLKDSKPSSLEPFFSFLPTTSTGMTISRSGWKAFSTFSSSGSKVPSPLGWYLSASANFTSHTFWPCWFFCGTSFGSPVWTRRSASPSSLNFMYFLLPAGAGNRSSIVATVVSPTSLRWLLRLRAWLKSPTAWAWRQPRP